MSSAKEINMETDVDSLAISCVPESLLKRQQERNERLLKKKEANIDGQANQAYLQLFNQQFRLKQVEIEKGVKKASCVAECERAEIFHSLSADLNILHRHLASASTLLTPYDLRVLKDTVTGLERLVTQAQASLIPKKKFSFKKKQEKSVILDKTEESNKNCKDTVDNGEIKIDLSGPGFHERENEHLELCEEEVGGREVTLSHLTGCTVIIRGCPCSVFIRSIRNTTLLLGPVATSVLLYGASDCTVVTWCHQMRIHDSTDSDFYIRVASDPIIENCRKVRFAPYSYSYPGSKHDEEASGLDYRNDRWDNVKDFDWLVTSHPSPYWSIIPVDLRRTHWPD